MIKSRSQRETIVSVKTIQIGYLINKLNGKKYVTFTSQAKGIKERLYEEQMRSFKPQKHKSNPLRAAMQADGPDNFEAVLVKETICETAARSMKNSLIKEMNLTDPTFGYNQR